MTRTIEALLDDPKWSWRHADFRGATPAEDEAGRHLREQADMARSWLLGVSEAVGLSLPIGNGLGGPWNRIAVSNGTQFGILDIAKGTLSITSVEVPEFVRMFLMVGSATSHNMAGGSGSLPDGWGQVPLVLYAKTKPSDTTAKIIERVWGFRTCYGTTGTPPEPIDGVVDIETDLPQWEDFPSPHEVDPEAWERLMGTGGDDTVRLRPGYMTRGGIKMHIVSVYGNPTSRKDRIHKLLAKWEPLATAEANKPLEGATPDDDLPFLLQKVYARRKQLGLPPLPRLPSGRSGWDSNVHAVRHALISLGFEDIAPPDPRSPEHMAEVNRIVEAILAVPPAEMASKLDGPHSANRASYLIKHALPNERRVYDYDDDVEDDPRADAYLAAVRQEF